MNQDVAIPKDNPLSSSYGMTWRENLFTLLYENDDGHIDGRWSP